MAPGRELWTWTVPEGTDHFELLVDDTAPLGSAAHRDARFSATLEPGDHTLKVRACDAEGLCSAWTSHTTRVESFGEGLPRGLRDAARVLPATALGHKVAVGCNDCADGLKGEVLNLEAAAASVERALDRGADLIELNVASIAGSLYASPTDSADAGVRPLLAMLLAREKIAAADAIIALEVVEDAPKAADAMPPAAFARALFEAIDAVPGVARNGRPLWVRAGYDSRDYLRALAAEAAGHPLTGPYVRFVASDPGRDPASFYGKEVLVADLGFLDAVSVDFRLSNLPFRLERIRAAGSAAILENVPGPFHGEIVLAALREQVDVFITNYRVDQARGIATKPDTAGFFDARSISADGRVLTVRGIRGVSAITSVRELGKEPPPDVAFGFSTPPATLGSTTGDFFGSYLSFGGVGVSLGDVLAESSEGFLLAVSGLFQANPNAISTIAISSGFELQITPEGVLKLHASGSSAERDKELSVPASADAECASSNGVLSGSIDLGQPHWIVGAYDGGTRFSLFVDGRCAGELQTVLDPDGYQIGVVLAGFPPLFTGAIQQVSALRWEPAIHQHGEN